MADSGLPRTSSSPSPLESTSTLLAQIRDGDPHARERLMKRFLPTLRRWARGRLPPQGRDLADTDDLVQNTLIRALNRLDTFDPRREGAFLSYLRQIMLNQVRDEIRRSKRRPGGSPVDETLPDPGPSPLELSIGEETMRRYERGLAQLSEDHREAIILRFEFGYTCDEVAEAMGRTTPNAARQLIARALVRLSEVLHGSE